MNKLIAGTTVVASLIGCGLPGVCAAQQLPEITCDARNCWEVRPGSIVGPRAPTPLPIEAAPPAGQRLLFKPPSSSCVSILGTTSASSFDYLLGAGIDVPLGSSHISLDATLETRQFVTAGAAGGFGRLQLRRTGGVAWYNYGFGFTGTSLPSSAANQYSPASYMTLVELSDLPDGTGIPTKIDVRLTIYEVKSEFAAVSANDVCKGQLQLAF